MSDTFLSLTELGKLYGVSGHKIGKWLMSIGLRTPAKKPSSRVFGEGYVEQRGSTQPGTYIWIWHAEKTVKALGEAGIARPANNWEGTTGPPDSTIPG